MVWKPTTPGISLPKPVTFTAQKDTNRTPDIRSNIGNSKKAISEGKVYIAPGSHSPEVTNWAAGHNKQADVNKFLAGLQDRAQVNTYLQAQAAAAQRQQAVSAAQAKAQSFASSMRTSSRRGGLGGFGISANPLDSSRVDFSGGAPTQGGERIRNVGPAASKHTKNVAGERAKHGGGASEAMTKAGVKHYVEANTDAALGKVVNPKTGERKGGVLGELSKYDAFVSAAGGATPDNPNILQIQQTIQQLYNTTHDPRFKINATGVWDQQTADAFAVAAEARNNLGAYMGTILNKGQETTTIINADRDTKRAAIAVNGPARQKMNEMYERPSNRNLDGSGGGPSMRDQAVAYFNNVLKDYAKAAREAPSGKESVEADKRYNEVRKNFNRLMDPSKTDSFDLIDAWNHYRLSESRAEMKASDKALGHYTGWETFNANFTDNYSKYVAPVFSAADAATSAVLMEAGVGLAYGAGALTGKKIVMTDDQGRTIDGSVGAALLRIGDAETGQGSPWTGGGFTTAAQYLEAVDPGDKLTPGWLKEGLGLGLSLTNPIFLGLPAVGRLFDASSVIGRFLQGAAQAEDLAKVVGHASTLSTAVGAAHKLAGNTKGSWLAKLFHQGPERLATRLAEYAGDIASKGPKSAREFKLIKGMNQAGAERLAAASALGPEATARAAVMAMATGEWAPHVGTINQLWIATGHLGAPTKGLFSSFGASHFRQAMTRWASGVKSTESVSEFILNSAGRPSIGQAATHKLVYDKLAPLIPKSGSAAKANRQALDVSQIRMAIDLNAVDPVYLEMAKALLQELRRKTAGMSPEDLAHVEVPGLGSIYDAAELVTREATLSSAAAGTLARDIGAGARLEMRAAYSESKALAGLIETAGSKSLQVIGKSVLQFLEKDPEALLSITGFTDNALLTRAEFQETVGRLLDGVRGPAHLTPEIEAELMGRFARVVKQIPFEGGTLTAGTIKDVQKIFRQVTRRIEDIQGLPKNVLDGLFTGQLAKLENPKNLLASKKTIYGMTEDGVAATTPLAASQTQTVISLATRTQIQRGITDALAAGGSKSARLRVSFRGDNILLHIPGIGAKTNTVILNIAKYGHGVWKALVVTNMTMVPIGALSAYMAAQSGILGQAAQDNPFLAAAVGAGLGTVSGVFRFTARQQVPDFVAKWLGENTHLNRYWNKSRAQLGSIGEDVLDPYGFTVRSELGPRGVQHELANGHLSAMYADDYALINPNNPRFKDSWANILNKQVNPTHDPIMALLLEHKAGHITDDILHHALKEVQKSDFGKAWMRKMRGGGYKNFDDAVAASRGLVDQVADEAIAKARLAGPIDPSDIKKLTEFRPKYVSAPKTWKSTRFIRDIFKPTGGTIARWATETGSTHGARAVMAKAIYRNEENRLIAMGQSARDAHNMAEEIAVSRNNAIMDRVDNFSRGARKADYVSPFIGNQIFATTTWARLALENPGKTLALYEKAALTFNAGERLGIFRQDYNGNWVMSVPGSAWLSEALFGQKVGLDVNLSGFMAETQGSLSPDGFSLLKALPAPGGPYMQVAAKAFSEVFPQLFDPNSDAYMGDALHDYLFTFGATGRLLRSEPSKLWQAATGSPAPWEFASRDQQVAQLNKDRQNMLLEMIHDHREKFPEDLDWLPSEKEVEKATRAFLLLRGFIGAAFPATPHPIYPGQSEYNAARNAFTMNGKLPWNQRAFLDRYPVFAPYMTKRGTYQVPEDSFQNQAKNAAAGKRSGYIPVDQMTPYTLHQFRNEIKQGQQLNQAFRALRDANAIQVPRDREMALVKWRAEYPDAQKFLQNNNQKEVDLARILLTYPKGMQSEAIARWREQYQVSPQAYNKLYNHITTGAFRFSGPLEGSWAVTRTPEAVEQDVLKHVGQHDPLDSRVTSYVSMLSPAEQLLWLSAQQRNLSDAHDTYNPDGTVATNNFKKVMDTYKALGKMKSHVYTQYPWLNDRWNKNSGATDFDGEAIGFANRSATYQGDEVEIPLLQRNNAFAYKAMTRTTIQPMYDEINSLYARIDSVLGAPGALKSNGKQTQSTYLALQPLYDRIKGLFNQIKVTQNDFYNKNPDMTQLQKDIHDLTIYTEQGWTQKAIETYQRAQRDSQNMPWLPSNEVGNFLAKPPQVRQAYIDQLVAQLLLEPTSDAATKAANKAAVGSKLYWDYLTTFQQDLIKANLPQSTWKKFESMHPEMYNGKKGFKFYGYRNGNGDLVHAELDYAYALMTKYNKRAKGAKPPAAYALYRQLPANPAVRSQFLKEHPEVAKWIKDGPMANMPPIYAEIVADIMVRNGKWAGDVSDTNEITDLAFARSQLERWNMRGNRKAPDTYDFWLNMPSGGAKAAYLAEHPEIENWLQLGPMANMPDEYKNTVRDIMQRYGEWTERQDPLGETITQYYSTPQYAKQDFLAQHPELVAYWNASRTPQQKALMAKADQYFAILDPAARRTFLAANPDLSTYFMNQRTQRYERFLNQVAQYMGTDPSTFQKYLDKQQEVLNELLIRFAEPNLIAEGQTLAPGRTSTQSTESGRIRGN